VVVVPSDEKSQDLEDRIQRVEAASAGAILTSDF